MATAAGGTRARLNTVRNRLVLLFFVITTGAVGFVYLYVVPQLDSSLTADKLRRLEQNGGRVGQRVSAILRSDLDDFAIRRRIRGIAGDTSSRVTLLGLPTGGTPFVIADSERELTALEGRWSVVDSALAAGTVRSGIESLAEVRTGETAVPIYDDGRAVWAAVMSVPLDDVDSNVALIRRQIVIAGAIALLAALGAGWLAASSHSRRLRRLEEAAEEVAEGNFDVPIPIGSMDEVGQLGATFNEMQTRLAQLDSARSEFIANASHELRTPVFSLSGFMELLAEEEPDAETREEFLESMREQIDRLRLLTVDLLDLSKIDAGVMAIRNEEVALGSLAKQIAAEFATRTEAGGMNLVIDVPEGGGPLCRADSRRVSQILRILLDNSITHTPEGTTITISASSEGQHSDLSVTDDGPGIEAAARPRVFERFFSGDSVSGSGLGLAIARELADLMRGSLELSSRRGNTRFTLRLPGARITTAGTDPAHWGAR